MRMTRQIALQLAGFAAATVLVGLLLPGPVIEAQNPRVIGAHANAWSAAAVGVSGTSAAVDTMRVSGFCSAFGNSSAAATLTVQLSQNGTNWYSSGTNTGAVTGDFGLNFTTGARHVRLISNAASTITATVACR